jgi:hypothetical protein
LLRVRNRPWRRLASLLAMFTGAFSGGVLVLQVSASAALGRAVSALALVAFVAY